MWRPVSWGTFALAAVLTLAACERSASTPDAGGDSDGFDRTKLLASVADNVILPALDRSAASMAALAAATRGAGPGRQADKAQAQAAWRAAMVDVQWLEVLQLGPAGALQLVKGGQGLRDKLYAWPLVNDCLVDQETFREGYLAADFFEKKVVTAFGMGALEYLLFRPDADEACPEFAGIDDGWAALGAETIAARRMAYAAALAQHASEQVTTLREAWRGGFRDKLATGAEPYASAQDAVNEIFAAAYYVELKVKDLKLAIPVGLSTKCAATSCPERAESRWSEQSTANLRENLRALEAIFYGGPREQAAANVGFDDFLVARNAAELRDALAQALTDVLTDLDALPGSFEATIASDLARAKQVHAKVKAVTDLLKTQLVTTLNLRVPQEGAGDND